MSSITLALRLQTPAASMVRQSQTIITKLMMWYQPRAMQVIARRTLNEFWHRHPQAEGPSESRHREEGALEGPKRAQKPIWHNRRFHR
jgi:hypothetical protein